MGKMGKTKEFQVLFIASLFAATSAYAAVVFHDSLHNLMDISLAWLLMQGTLLSTSVLAMVICLDIWRLRPADSHTIETLMSQYIEITKLRMKAPFIRHYVEQMTNNPVKANEKTLMKILRENQNTEYGRKYKFSEIHSSEDFIKAHPITVHEHYRNMVERIMAGERNVLYPDEDCFLASTSGTTGGAKVYPLRDAYLKHGRYIIEELQPAYSVLSMMDLKRSFVFHIFSPVRSTSGGSAIGAASQQLFSFPKHNLLPEEYQKLVIEDQSYYTMALFALAERELSSIEGFSPDLMNAFMKFTVKNWENLCHDIERGMVGDATEIPDEIRASLSARLKADPERAASLREVMKHGVVGLAKRVWPDLVRVRLGKSAGFKTLASKLIDNHLKGVHVIGFSHGATEGVTGLVLEEKYEIGDKDEFFTIFPDVCFMEFIPLENVEEENPKTIQIDKLQVGECYEVVQTNENGLYRNRYGDVIKIVGHMNKTPKYEFVYRLGQRLNIAYERTPESILIKALQTAEPAANIGTDISDFTTTESTTIEEITGAQATKGHYVFFIEFGEKLESVSDLAQKIDQNLLDSYELYKRYQDIGSIGDLEIIQVKPGTMDEMKDLLMGGKVNPQFKMPRVIRKEPIIKHLIKNKMTN